MHPPAPWLTVSENNHFHLTCTTYTFTDQVLDIRSKNLKESSVLSPDNSLFCCCCVSLGMGVPSLWWLEDNSVGVLSPSTFKWISGTKLRSPESPHPPWFLFCKLSSFRGCLALVHKTMARSPAFTRKLTMPCP